MKILLLLLIISFGLMAIFTTFGASLVEGGDNKKHNNLNFMNKKGRKIIYGGTKKEDNNVMNKYYTDSIGDAYPSANGASIDSHHQTSIDDYRKIINRMAPFHP